MSSWRRSSIDLERCFFKTSFFVKPSCSVRWSRVSLQWHSARLRAIVAMLSGERLPTGYQEHYVIIHIHIELIT